MKEQWFQRLEDAIKQDGRSLRQISEDAKCGPNFIQQLLKYRKDPRASQLAKIFDTLGPGTDLYVLTGHRLSQQDLDFLRVASTLDEEAQRDALAVLRRLTGTQSEPSQSGDLPEKASAKVETSH
ncbi:helix-turn-helix domain-containing protein [Salipiger manganoxidans]|uniref:helix-turn-helix domain-containing protein n=1 Tax=Salipiger marinus TaxID=555512 RepID=UPI001E419031|nr:helix-turn-helix domain-containing protein [Salipiger manganoxidans]MCD1619162.1 helix-turn-helix domain-containing protein [Salipiger manganoxidans]